MPLTYDLQPQPGSQLPTMVPQPPVQVPEQFTTPLAVITGWFAGAVPTQVPPQLQAQSPLPGPAPACAAGVKAGDRTMNSAKAAIENAVLIEDTIKRT